MFVHIFMWVHIIKKYISFSHISKLNRGEVVSVALGSSFGTTSLDIQSDIESLRRSIASRVERTDNKSILQPMSSVGGAFSKVTSHRSIITFYIRN